MQLDRGADVARVALAQHRYGATPAFLAEMAAELHGDHPGIIDELGTVTFGELQRDARRLAAALHTHFDLDATRHVVRLQAESGIDIANTGEQARESFFTYVQHRMSGFGGQSDRPPFADMRAFPTFLEMIMAQMRARVQVDLLHAPKAIGAVKYLDRAPLNRECAILVVPM